MQKGKQDKQEANEKQALYAAEVHNTLHQMMQNLVVEDVKQALDEKLTTSNEQTKELFKNTQKEFNGKLITIKGKQNEQFDALKVELQSQTNELSSMITGTNESLRHINNALVEVWQESKKQHTTQIVEQDLPELKRQFVFQQKLLYASLTLQGFTVLGVLAGVLCYIF